VAQAWQLARLRVAMPRPRAMKPLKRLKLQER